MNGSVLSRIGVTSAQVNAWRGYKSGAWPKTLERSKYLYIPLPPHCSVVNCGPQGWTTVYIVCDFVWCKRILFLNASFSFCESEASQAHVSELRRTDCRLEWQDCRCLSSTMFVWRVRFANPPLLSIPVDHPQVAYYAYL